jgi:hypothetical protein
MYTNIGFLSTVYNERRSGLPLPPEDGSPRPLISMGNFVLLGLVELLKIKNPFA